MPTKVALLGSGLFAKQAYLPALLKSTDTILHTIWSRSESSAQNLLSEVSKTKPDLSPSVQFGDDGLEKVLADKEVEAVLLVLPITTQPALIIRALKAGKHVLSEKPVGKDVKTARELIEVYEKEYLPKGLIWRVAENFAHEPMIHQAAEVLKRPALGPVLYWQLRSEGTVVDGSSWQATEWRTIPDYQGGFLLDGGVHQCALIRCVLPTTPNRIISTASLHRTHLPPHDTVMALALSDPSTTTDPHGPPTKLKALFSHNDIPSSPGQSSPHGQILMSFAAPDAGFHLPKSGLYVTCLNGRVAIEQVSGTWTVRVTGAKDGEVKDEVLEGKGDGVALEIDMLSRAIQGGKKEENYGDPRSTLWDVALIEAMLTSDGKEVDLKKLMAGE